MVVYNKEYSLLLKELTEVNNMNKKFADDDDMQQETKDWRDDIKERLGVLKEKKRKIQDEEESLRIQSPKKQVVAYYQQIGSFPGVSVSVGAKSKSSDTSTITASVISNNKALRNTESAKKTGLEMIRKGNLSYTCDEVVVQDELQEEPLTAFGHGRVCNANAEAHLHSEEDED